MLEQEAVEVVKQFDLLIDYQDAILFVIDYVETNAHILNCAYDSMGRDEMKRFFCNDFNEIIRRIIDDMEKSLHLTVPEDFKQFICNLYMEGLAGTLIDCFKNQGSNDREKDTQLPLPGAALLAARNPASGGGNLELTSSLLFDLFPEFFYLCYGICILCQVAGIIG